MSDTTLLPCPFCGGRAAPVVLFERSGFFVRCNKCEVLMHRMTRDGAAAAWNARHTQGDAP